MWPAASGEFQPKGGLALVPRRSSDGHLFTDLPLDKDPTY